MILPCSVQTNTQGEELREHGTRLFPVACYLDLLPRDEIAWHWHNELELGLIASGSAVVETGSASCVLHAGEGFLSTAIFCTPQPYPGTNPVRFIPSCSTRGRSAAARIT